MQHPSGDSFEPRLRVNPDLREAESREQRHPEWEQMIGEAADRTVPPPPRPTSHPSTTTPLSSQQPELPRRIRWGRVIFAIAAIVIIPLLCIAMSNASHSTPQTPQSDQSNQSSSYVPYIPPPTVAPMPTLTPVPPAPPLTVDEATQLIFDSVGSDGDIPLTAVTHMNFVTLDRGQFLEPAPRIEACFQETFTPRPGDTVHSPETFNTNATFIYDGTPPVWHIMMWDMLYAPCSEAP